MSDINNVFKFEKHKYKNNVDPINDYLSIASNVLNKMFDMDRPADKLKSYIKNNKLFKNPKVKFYERDLKGNRTIKVDTLNNYINSVKRDNNIIVPSFTVYFSKKKKESLHAEFININVRDRSKHKKLAFKYDMAKDYDKANYHTVLQKVKKIFNNSLSGAYASVGTILNNPSAHYTLTSITRALASIGNTISESIISGNRHYRSPDIMFNHIATIVDSIDYKRVKKVIDDYNLYLPTADEVLLSLLKSSSKYWRDVEKENLILEYLSKLNAYERAYVLYHNDLYHIRKFNDKLIRDILTKTINYELKHYSLSELEHILATTEDWLLNLTYHIVSSRIVGKSKDKFTVKDKEHMVSFILNFKEIFLEHRELINTFLVTEIFPPSIAYIKDMVRESIVLSDTDSTCATYGEWVNWYYGEDKFTNEAVSLSAVVMTIVAQSTDHYIKVFSINMNITFEAASNLKMKNEYFWPTFVNTNVSKHYFADVAIVEGNVKDYSNNILKSLEKKGVNLIAPQAYPPARELGDELQLHILKQIKTNNKLDLSYYLDKILAMERLIYEKIKQGSPDVLKLEKIKEAKSYKLEPIKSPYFYYMLWEEVFSLKYGKAPDPEYMAVKLPTLLDSKKDMSNFLDSIEDENIERSLRLLMGKAKKDKITVFRLPLIIVYNKGLPIELLDIINYKRVIRDNVNHLYILLESIGYYVKKDSCLLNELEDMDL